MLNDNNHPRDNWRVRRLIDIATVVFVFALIFSGYRYFAVRADIPTQTSFIVPSQTVHW